MEKYYCMTSTGVRPPNYAHSSIESAAAEAERLAIQFNCKVEILKVVGTVSFKEVPVVERKRVLEFEPGYGNDYLPF